MNCMKCGRETEGENVFCQDCLLEMEKYPVLPETVVLLPRRRENSNTKKTQKRHIPTPEEQIQEMRKWLRILILLLFICIAAIAMMIKPTLHYAMDEHVQKGQNYSSVVPTTTQPAAQ